MVGLSPEAVDYPSYYFPFFFFTCIPQFRNHLTHCYYIPTSKVGKVNLAFRVHVLNSSKKSTVYPIKYFLKDMVVCMCVYIFICSCIWVSVYGSLYIWVCIFLDMCLCAWYFLMTPVHQQIGSFFFFFNFFLNCYKFI